ncbi:hypothetical protein DFH08DRAFT_811633 [Mycena albidolilacea]|uniref:Integrase core domain-containing protein n=1 Tax=Mycena albidolilacea TaxID=1033008 RepID=A0AAD6ZVU9_9AGAR|nr:hypothetical protein DFH08DRAFT_811633 [Mycena albidolilacea]
MVNRSSKNEPPDDVLKESLMKYASLKLSVAQRLANLAQDHNYHIKNTKLKQLNTQFNVPTVCKPAPISVISTLVCDKIDDDINQANGSDAVKTFLALDGFQIPRLPMAQGYHMSGHEGQCARFFKDSVYFQELHFDGHEKLANAVLRMGPIGISVYSARDKGSGIVPILVAAPDARQSVVVGHIYLDSIEEFGAFPLQVTVDKGSETGEMYAAQKALRFVVQHSNIFGCTQVSLPSCFTGGETFTPDINPMEWPELVALKSVNNILIENLWKWLLKTFGRSLHEYIEYGKYNGLFHPANDMHVHLFHWVWSKIVQIQLDKFKLYWNHHTPRKNPKKELISGIPPIEVYRNPETY